MSDKSKTVADATAFVDAVAARNGWRVNRDAEFTADIAAGLATNYNRYGYFLCPCRDGDGDRASDRDIICPCQYSTADIAEHGHCFCGLYLSESFSNSGSNPEPIPERRPG